ncbi:MAG: hypothetical protein ABI905_00440 [Betaproteobacteria bacterium]
MRWPDTDKLQAMMPLPDGYRWQRLQRQEIPEAIAAIRSWFPAVGVGVASCFLRETYYETQVSFDETDAASEDGKNVLAIIIRHGDELVGFGSWEREPDALSLYGKIGMIAPAHRNARLAVRAMELGEAIGRHIGAGFIYNLATLKTPHMQLALERAGYQLVGVTPGYDREIVGEGVIKRVYEALYAKVLVPDEELLVPDPENLSPRVRELFALLFPRSR